jgi:acetyl esterase/lipase
MDVQYLWEHRAPMALGDADEDRPSLQPYLVGETVTPSPAVLVCPGGGYNHLAKHEMEPIALWFNSLGISAFVLRYRVKPYQPDAAFLDACRAVRLIRHRAQDWCVDPSRIGMIGFSAGGHLAAMTGTRSAAAQPDAADPADRLDSRPNLLMLAYPFISVGREEGSAPPDDFAPDKWITEETPPAFIWHTSEDAKVSALNSLKFAEGLERVRVPYSLHIFPKGPHGLGLAFDHPECSAWTELCAAWLREQGF